MIRKLITILCVASLSGCALIQNPAPIPDDKLDYIGKYYFGYQVNGMSGYQVFDNGSITFVNVPKGLVVEKVTYGDNVESVYKQEDYVVKIPVVASSFHIITNMGSIIAERKNKINSVQEDKGLKKEILEAKLSELKKEMAIINERITKRMEKIK